MEDSVKNSAIALSDEGEVEKLYELIKPYIEEKDPFALYLFSNFSLVSFNESEEEFSTRSIEFKKQASEGGVAEASYRMAVNYLYGDDVPQSYKEASKYFERAVQQGHAYTKFTYGFSLYYGTDQNPKNEPRGLALMAEAASEGIDLAKAELAKIEADKNA